MIDLILIFLILRNRSNTIVTFYTGRQPEPQQNSYGNPPVIEVPVADLENF